MASNSNVPRSQEDYITQLSEEIEGRVTKKLSQEFSRTEKSILGALARHDNFLMNPLLQGHSGNWCKIGEKAIVLSVKGSIKLLSGVCLSKSFSVYFLKISYIKEVSPKSYGVVRNNTESTYVFFPEKIKYINGSFQKSSLSETIH